MFFMKTKNHPKLILKRQEQFDDQTIKYFRTETKTNKIK